MAIRLKGPKRGTVRVHNRMINPDLDWWWRPTHHWPPSHGRHGHPPLPPQFLFVVTLLTHHTGVVPVVLGREAHHAIRVVGVVGHVLGRLDVLVLVLGVVGGGGGGGDGGFIAVSEETLCSVPDSSVSVAGSSPGGQEEDGEDGETQDQATKGKGTAYRHNSYYKVSSV